MNMFRKHRDRTLAEAAARESARSGGDAPVTEGNIYEQMFAQINAHKAELKAIQSVKAKAARKAELLPDYEAYIEGVLTAGEAAQDDVVMTVFVWAIDAANYTLARDISEWALENNISMPPEFTRSAATFWVEQIADAYLSDVEADSAMWPEFLSDIAHQVTDHDMPDPVRAKLFKAIGFATAEDEPQAALDALQIALDFDANCGVKSRIKSLKKTLKPASPAPVLTTEANAKTHKVKTDATDSEADAGADAKATENEQQ